jgi:hypothetical protein
LSAARTAKDEAKQLPARRVGSSHQRKLDRSAIERSHASTFKAAADELIDKLEKRTRRSTPAEKAMARFFDRT